MLCSLTLAAIYGTGQHVDNDHASLASLTRGWVTPSVTDGALMAGCGLIAAIGLTLLTQA